MTSLVLNNQDPGSFGMVKLVCSIYTSVEVISLDVPSDLFFFYDGKGTRQKDTSR